MCVWGSSLLWARRLLHRAPPQQPVLPDPVSALRRVPGDPLALHAQAGPQRGHAASRSRPYLPTVHLHRQVARASDSHVHARRAGIRGKAQSCTFVSSLPKEHLIIFLLFYYVAWLVPEESIGFADASGFIQLVSLSLFADPIGSGFIGFHTL